MKTATKTETFTGKRSKHDQGPAKYGDTGVAFPRNLDEINKMQETLEEIPSLHVKRP